MSLFQKILFQQSHWKCFIGCNNTTFFHFFDVVVNVGNIFYIENVHISGNMCNKIRIKGRLIFSSKFVTFWGLTRG